MKTRNGFVSNSSSSSYIILLPENFDPEEFTFSEDDYYDVSEERAKAGLRRLINNGEIGEWDDYEVFHILSESLSDYKIGGFDTGPDSGGLSLANKDKIKSILGV